MGELACPQCGNSNLDVDEQSSVVYCKQCGFAVKVDPQTGEATPLAPGGQTGAAPSAPPVYVEKSVFGMDPLTFWMSGFAILLILFFLGVVRDATLLFLLVVVLTVIWWMKK